MARKWHIYIAGSMVLVALAGCGRSFLFGQREPWRREAEIACLKSGAVKESVRVVRMDSIDGPGMCGAEYPFKVIALGEVSALGFADNLRPPGAIPGVPDAQAPRWPDVQPRYSNPYGDPPRAVTSAPLERPAAEPRYAPPSYGGRGPLTIAPPGREPAGLAPGNYDRGTVAAAPPRAAEPRRRSIYDPPPDAPGLDDEDVDNLPTRSATPSPRGPAGPYYSPAPQRPIQVPLRSRANAIVPIEIKPEATLACPIVSALDQWFATSVQPMARHWFGQPVVEIRQISAYSCRGMNGNPNARVSEHAFGNALDIAAFVLADGRRVTVKDGWKGTPEEQGFLRDIQGAACEMFTTVLAPGSNRFHYDHIHVDLMRRPSASSVCEPGVVSGEVVARRASRNGIVRRGDPDVTGSIGVPKPPAMARKAPKKFFSPEAEDEAWIEDEALDEMRRKEIQRAQPLQRESLATP
jgi:hypothetical protein